MKNKMKVLGGLLLAVVFTAFQVSGTYAKYVSDIDIIDSARVAKWDVTITKPTEVSVDLFKSSYVYNGKNYVEALPNSGDVVAPGTTGTYEVTFTGQVETAFYYEFDMQSIPEFTVSYDPTTGAVVADGTAGAKVYNPLKYRAKIVKHSDNSTIWANNNTASDAWMTGTELKAFFDAYKALTPSQTDKKWLYYPVGNLNQSLVIEWKWDANTVEAGLTADQVNALDTYLGKNMATTTKNFTMNVAAIQYTAEDVNTGNLAK